MTLDEAIKRAEYKEKVQRELFGLCPSETECDGYSDCVVLTNGKDMGCLKCAQEYKQIAEWLKELKSTKRLQAYWEWFEEWSFNGEIKECDEAGFRCSNCKQVPDEKLYFDDPECPPEFEFCPHCGAEMSLKLCKK